ncbi:MAG: thiamine pyrophosphate-dependent enzyme [Candidatus Hermodarchaeota archaeon]|nr:thiamine pyrophosphate-dependent enzyme [Candidatus Hermodarchaeota archaeon]
MTETSRISTIEEHPILEYIRRDRLPHIFCSACGIGTVLQSFATALRSLNYDMDNMVIISGIGCTGRASGYFAADSYHTTHGRAIAFATGVKVANPKLKPVVISGDGDLFAIGGNHFIHAARRNVDMLVLCVNNFNYGMTGGQMGPTTPVSAITVTSPDGNIEHPFNLVSVAAASGAVFVARWTALHARRLTKSIEKALQKKGFTFIEVVSPCPTLYDRYNRHGTGLEVMKKYREISVIRNFSDPMQAEIDYRTRIVCGEFVDSEKPEFSDLLEEHGKKLQKGD